MRSPKNHREKNYQLGIWAETFAVWYLRSKLYRIIARRMRNYFGEIDIIAGKGKCLIFIEVKIRSLRENLSEVLTIKQRTRIMSAASRFIAQNRQFADYDLRFDLILLSPWAWPVHLINAWQQDR